LAAGLAADLDADLATGLTAGLTSDALGTSPIRDLTGQILKIGHFLQPTAMAMGQIVIFFPVWVLVLKLCSMPLRAV